MIIGLTGNIGSGKDTVAKMMQYYFACKNVPSGFGQKDFPPIDDFLNTYDEWILMPRFSNNNWQIKKFAYKLKQIASILVGCNVEDFESQEFKDKIMPDEFQSILGFQDGVTEHKQTKRTYRWLLQTLGTEAIRNNIHKDVWINALFCDYSKSSNWIISDIRFLNEADAI